LVLVIIAICSPAWPQTRKVPEGFQPYVPTRLEWLEVELNASYRVDISSDNYFGMSFLADHAGDAIVIIVRYSPKVNREYMNRSIDLAKQMISKTAETNGWSSWLKVKEDVEMMKPK